MKDALGHRSNPSAAHQAKVESVGLLYPHANLSATKLQAAYQKQKAENLRLNGEMIATGRGYERPSKTRTKTDELSRRVNAAADRHNSLLTEIRRREEFSGSLKRLPARRRQASIEQLCE